jgi:transposase
LADLVRYHRGDKNVWSVVHVPDEEHEDDRQLHRGLERLKHERTSLRSRLSSLLATQGIRLMPSDARLRKVDTLQNWARQSLLPGPASEIARIITAIDLVESQIRAIEKEQSDRLRSPETPAMNKIHRLSHVRGIGMDSSWLLVMEFFGWRIFVNRRQVAGAAGLGGTPYSSGQTTRELGISKAGNARVRTRMIELAWMWLRLQPDSKRTQWFQRRFGDGAKRGRRRGIVALARMLLIDLWHFVEHGVVPPGAQLKPATPCY